MVPVEDTEPFDIAEPSDVTEVVDDAEPPDVTESVDNAEVSDVAEPVNNMEPSERRSGDKRLMDNLAREISKRGLAINSMLLYNVPCGLAEEMEHPL